MTVRVYHITTRELLEMIRDRGHKISMTALLLQAKNNLLRSGVCVKKTKVYLFSDDAIDYVEYRPTGRPKIKK